MLDVKGKTILERQIEVLGASASATSSSCAATRRSRSPARGVALRRQRPLRRDRRAVLAAAAPSAELERAGACSSTATSSSSRRSWRSSLRHAAPTSRSWSIAPSTTRFRAGLPPPRGPARPGRHRDAAQRPSLRGARGRQPRAAHRARRRARGGARRVHRHRDVLGRRRGGAARRARRAAAARAEGLERASLTHLLQAMIDRGHAVVAVDVHKGWMEIDSFDDYRRAWAEVGALTQARVVSAPFPPTASSTAPRRRLRLLRRRAVLAGRPGDRRARAARGSTSATTREDAALGVAAGAYLGGRLPMVLMQNSGLGVSVNALGSLHILYEMPVLLLVTWRGYEGKDAPEHLVMGEVLPRPARPASASRIACPTARRLDAPTSTGPRPALRQTRKPGRARREAGTLRMISSTDALAR